VESNDDINAEKVEVIKKAGLDRLEVFIVIPMQDEADVVRNTLRKDRPTRRRRRGNRIYNLLRPGEPPRADSAARSSNKLFFNPKRLRPGTRRPLQAHQKLPHEYLLPAREIRKRPRRSACPTESLDAVPRGLHRHHQVLLLLRTAAR